VQPSSPSHPATGRTTTNTSSAATSSTAGVVCGDEHADEPVCAREFRDAVTDQRDGEGEQFSKGLVGQVLTDDHCAETASDEPAASDEPPEGGERDDDGEFGEVFRGEPFRDGVDSRARQGQRRERRTSHNHEDRVGEQSPAQGNRNDDAGQAHVWYRVDGTANLGLQDLQAPRWVNLAQWDERIFTHAREIFNREQPEPIFGSYLLSTAFLAAHNRT
jgi:hypothetical protein